MFKEGLSLRLAQGWDRVRRCPSPVHYLCMSSPPSPLRPFAATIFISVSGYEYTCIDESARAAHQLDRYQIRAGGPCS